MCYPGTPTVFICTNAPFLLIAPPPNLCKVHISWFYIPLYSQKKIHFSTSPIEYRTREIKKIKTKHGSFDHWCIKSCKNTRSRLIISLDLRFVSNILSSPAIIHVDKQDQGCKCPPPPPPWKMYLPPGIYMDKYGSLFLKSPGLRSIYCFKCSL